MRVFEHRLTDWTSWLRVYKSREALAPVINCICEREKLRDTDFAAVSASTNAVFASGKFVLKIFAPPECGMEVGSDADIELFGLRRASRLGISVPRPLAAGVVDDAYAFRYIVMERIHGMHLNRAAREMSGVQKQALGARLRDIADSLNTPCEDFGAADVLAHALSHTGWTDYPASFQQERLYWLQALVLRDDELVYCHGDLNPDNVLVGDDMSISILDFADSVRAPRLYEHAVVASELFRFDKSFMRGFFGDCDPMDVLEFCTEGLLLHDIGNEILPVHIGSEAEITSLAVMRERLYDLIV